MKDASLKVEEANIGKRLDKYICESFPDYSRTLIQNIIKDGLVLVNEETEKSGYKLRESDEIIITIPDLKVPTIEAEDIPLTVVFEDDDVIVINKPQGMITHPTSGVFTGTLVNALLHHCRNSLSGINGVLRPGIVHRLDKETSGLIIACKNDKSHAHIAEQIKNREVQRSYYALTYGSIKNDSGMVNKPIGRHRVNRHMMAVVEGGRVAITHWAVIQRHEKYSFVECNLETGRTHQIRVHMANIYHPILGDDLYGRKNDKTKKMMLHAYKLVFKHPISKKEIKLETPIPERFMGFIK